MLSCSAGFFCLVDVASLPEEGQGALPVRGGADPGGLLLRAEAVPRLDLPGPLQEHGHLARPGVAAQVHVRFVDLQKRDAETDEGRGVQELPK